MRKEQPFHQYPIFGYLTTPIEVQTEGKIVSFVIGKILCMLCFAAMMAQGATIVVSVDTTPRKGLSGGIAFDFLNGDPLSNTATISDFFTDGALTVETVRLGTITGTLPQPVVFSDAGFGATLEQQLIFGDLLSFTVHITQNFSGSFLPDSFAFFILDDAGFPLPTDDPLGSAAFAVDVDGTSTGMLSIFSPIDDNDLSFSVQAIPEPSPLPLVVLALSALAWRRRTRGPATRLGHRIIAGISADTDSETPWRLN